MAGYSGSPLVKKLGVKLGSKVLLVGAPDGYRKLLEPLPEAVEFVPRLSASTEIVRFFSAKKVDLEKALTAFRKKLNPTAVLWVSWPKKSARVPTDITRPRTGMCFRRPSHLPRSHVRSPKAAEGTCSPCHPQLVRRTACD